MPGLLPAVDLMQKDKDGSIKHYYTLNHSNRIQFVDGSLAADIPTERISELFNINTYIVSQVNPHIMPFVTRDSRDPDQSRLKHLVFNTAKGLLGNTATYLVN